MSYNNSRVSFVFLVLVLSNPRLIIELTKSLQCEASYFINFHDSKRSMHYLYQNVIGMANVPLTSVTSNGCNVIYVDTNVFFFFLPSKIHNKFHDINIFVVYK